MLSAVPGSRKRPQVRAKAAAFSLVIALAAVAPLSGAPGDAIPTGSPIRAPKKPADFFGLTNVWTIHLEVSLADWGSMVPARAAFRRPGPAGVPRLVPWVAAPPVVATGTSRTNRIDPAQDGFNYVAARVEMAGQKFENVGLRFKGHSSFHSNQGSLKRPFKLDFNRFVEGQKFLGLTKINLNNNAMDPSQIREALAYDIFRAAGVASSRTAFAKVYLTVPGVYSRQYVGLYTVVEQVDGKFLEDRFGSKNGLLLKPEVAPGLRYLGEDWSAYRRPYEAKTEPTPEEAGRFIQFIKLVTSADEETFRSRVNEFMDVDQFLRFLAVTVAIADMDSALSMGHNFYLFQPAPPKKIVWVPWDLNLSLGSASGQQGIELSIRHPSPSHNGVIEWILKDERWFNVYKEHLHDILELAFREDRVLEQVEKLRVVVREPIALESRPSLDQFESAVLGGGANILPPVNHVVRAAGQPVQLAFRAVPGGRAHLPLTQWLKARVQSIVAQLDGRSEGRLAGRGGPARIGETRFLGPGGRLAEQVFRDAGVKPDAKFSGDAFKRSVRQWFQRWDTDRNGTLNQTEIVAGIGSAFGPPHEMPAPVPFAMQARPRSMGPQGLLGPQWFRRFDLDRNAMISPAEWETVFERFFGEWDTSRDGHLEADELSRSLTHMLMASSEPMIQGGAVDPARRGPRANVPAPPKPNLR